MTKKVNTQTENLAKLMLANRLLKFRAWINDQNKIIKVFGFNEVLLFEQIFDSPCINENIYEIENCRLMQFTGLDDRNNVEIYEGDILKLPNGAVGVIEWLECGFVLRLKNEKIWQNLLFNVSKHYLIIGNVFENSDLLTQNE
jgi:hypothetical protein